MNGWESWSTASLVLMALELIPYKVVEQTLGSPDSIFKLSEGAQLELFRWIFNFKIHWTQGLFRDWTKSWTTMQHDAHWLRVGDTSGSLSVDTWNGENRSHPVSMSSWMYFHICSICIYFIFCILYVMILIFFAFVSFLCVSHHLV